MKLKYSQIEMSILLMAKAFCLEQNMEEKRRMVIQFDDAYAGIVKDWKSCVEEKITDEINRCIFRKIACERTRERVESIITIEPLKSDDFEQVSYLAVQELGEVPWHPDELRPAEDFINSGFSYVAKKDNIIVGYIMAYKCSSYGGYEYIYIDTLVVSRLAQGQGIGSRLFNAARSEANKRNIFGLRLMTKRDIPAYEIYKHWGFEDMNQEYAHMRCI